MSGKEKDPYEKIPDGGYRRHGQVHRNPEEPIEESPETLERDVGVGQRIVAEPRTQEGSKHGE